MPLTYAKKQALAEHYSQELEAAPHVFLVDFTGVTVPQVTQLRSRIREVGGRYEVVKNRLVLRAVEGAALGGVRDGFSGATALAYSPEDPVALAKVLSDFAKEVPTLKFKGGLLAGQPVAAEEVERIAQLPGREQLIAQLLGLLRAPIEGLARVLAALPRHLVVALDQVRRQRETSGS